MIRGLHHVGMATHDIERLLTFYTKLIGCTEVIRFDWEAGYADGDRVVGLTGSAVKHAMMRAGNSYLEIFQFLSPLGKKAIPNRPVNDVGVSHFCFDVENVDEEYERLSSAGVRFHCPPVEMGGMVRTTYARDPDENVIELQQIIDPSVSFILPPFEGAVIRR